MSYPNSPLPQVKSAVILVDPFNDFLHPEGKLYGRVQESLVAADTVAHLRDLVNAAHAARIPIFYALHQSCERGNFDGWRHLSPSAARGVGAFAIGSWGAEILDGLEPDVPGNGDVVVSRHWNSSGFANTDLDYQLRQRDITHLVLAGMAANTCLESTARYARELGYHVTLLTDATAGFTTKAKDAATQLIWPLIAESVITVEEWTSSLRPISKV
ncbi:hypothetical protein BHE90_015297 [Fusarium euwallaceae]|uniref:Isochorismatase-like domain-containing protein n=1 Tax=Fusarium euwallaceae TaxID=1147111 RepID=A0A430L3I8_9HYPO|nr:hypothetical protein BHE90_015297 [Fusarium euwallaceae]